LNRGFVRWNRRKIGLGNPPIFAVKPDNSHGETNVTSGAVDLANIDATTNANKANGARLTAAFLNRLAVYGKEFKTPVPRRNRAVLRF
jgi:hypothetical protein